MKHLARWLIVVLLTLAPVPSLHAEKVADLPAPTGYVSDFAGVLSDTTHQRVEDLCIQVDRQAHAQIAVITIKTLDDDQSIEEFATQLEDKWKVGNKQDRGVLMIFVTGPTKGRIEVGYGLEGILNDAKVGDIGRSMAASAQQSDYNTAVPLGVQQVAQVIAADAGVALSPILHQYRRQQVPVQLSLWQVLLGGGAILLVLLFLVRSGNGGILWFLLGSLMGGGFGGGGGGRRGGGGDDNDSGGGFGGFGGGSSGGGGASGDW